MLRNFVQYESSVINDETIELLEPYFSLCASVNDAPIYTAKNARESSQVLERIV